MRGEEAAAMLPKPRPNAFAIGLGQGEIIQRGAGEKLKRAFRVWRRDGGETRLHLEEEHEPMGVALIAVLTDEAGEVKVRRREREAHFLVRLPAGTGVGRFANAGLELPAGRTPPAAIRLLSTVEEKDFVCCVEAVEEGGDFVRKEHGLEKELNCPVEGQSQHTKNNQCSQCKAADSGYIFPPIHPA